MRVNTRDRLEDREIQNKNQKEIWLTERELVNEFSPTKSIRRKRGRLRTNGEISDENIFVY
jgi:hypothetical protein